MLASFSVSSLKKMVVAASIPFAVAFSSVGQAAEPLKVAYSDWPGFVAWQVAIEKGWLKDAGLNIKFEWFDYGTSMEAFSAGKVDGVFVTNGDALVVGSGGTKNVMILVTDYSSGNDMIIGKPGIKSIKDLKGKKVGTEVGIVDHLLLLDALQKNGMKESDVTIVNTKINDTPQALAAGDLAAIGVFEPSASQALKLVAGSKPIYTSAQSPGLIYDVLTVNPASLSNHKADWAKLIAVWDKTVAYVNDPKTQLDALKIMAARDNLTPAEYVKFLKGTHLLNMADGKAVFQKGDTLTSMYGSTKNADNFNVKNAIYKQPQDVTKYIDPILYK